MRFERPENILYSTISYYIYSRKTNFPRSCNNDGIQNLYTFYTNLTMTQLFPTSLLIMAPFPSVRHRAPFSIDAIAREVSLLRQRKTEHAILCKKLTQKNQEKK